MKKKIVILLTLFLLSVQSFAVSSDLGLDGVGGDVDNLLGIFKKAADIFTGPWAQYVSVIGTALAIFMWFKTRGGEGFSKVLYVIVVVTILAYIGVILGQTGMTSSGATF